MTRNEAYAATVDRLEPDIHPVDPGAYYASAAISLRRIADVLEWFKADVERQNEADREAYEAMQADLLDDHEGQVQ